MATTIKQQIEKNAFFAALAPEFIDFLAAHAKARELSAGGMLFRYGEPATHFYQVLTGNISVEVAAIAGPTLELQNLGAGAVLGWSWLITPYKWSFQARCRAPTAFLEFDGTAVLEQCEKDPRFGYEMFKRFSALMSERLDSARRKMMKEWNPPGFA